MRESKEFKTLAAKSSPRRSAWSFVKFESGGPCKKGQTAAKTGCTPASGEGTKKEESGEAGDTQSKLDKLEKETMDSMRDMPTDHPAFDKTAAKMQKIAEAKIVDKARSGETEEAKAMAEEAGLEYEEVLKDAEKAAKEGVDILEDLLGFPKEDRAEIKSDKKKEGAAGGEEKGTGKETWGVKEISERMDYLKSQMGGSDWGVKDDPKVSGDKIREMNQEYADLAKDKKRIMEREEIDKTVQKNRDKMTPAEKRQEESEENRMRRAYKKAIREGKL